MTLASLRPSVSAIVVLLMASLLLAACTRNTIPRGGPLEPPPVPARKPVAPSGIEAMAAASSGPVAIPRSYQVQPGDTVYSVAQQFSLPLRSLIDSNQLEPPFALRPGQVLRLPAPRVHEVVSGDTVYGISRRYGVDMAALVRQNDIEEPYRIRVGQRLTLPDSGGTALAAVSPQGQPSGAVPTPESLQGGTASATAAPAPQTSPSRTPAPETLGDEGEAMVARPSEGRSGAVAEAPASPAAPATTIATTTAQAPAARPEPVPAPKVGPVPAPPPRAGGKFHWPLQGELLSSFGSKGDGLHNDGLNIAAPRGTRILAAENGVVAYAGNELRGFGNLLLIKHRDGWVTAYAHADKLLVGRGAKVQRGQPIALVGSTGNVSSPQLHFEIRKGTRAIDPEKVLAPRVASR